MNAAMIVKKLKTEMQNVRMSEVHEMRDARCNPVTKYVNRNWLLTEIKQLSDFLPVDKAEQLCYTNTH